MGNIFAKVYSHYLKNPLFKIVSIIFLLVAIYHFVGIFYKVNTSPLWRNALFVGINIFCVYGFLKRPKYFTPFLAGLTVQQLYSHGESLIKLWTEQKQIDWLSLGDIIFLPLVFILLLSNSRDTTKNRNST